jgi:hypothetical protein
MTDIANARRALVRRLLEGDGEAPRAQRQAAFENAGPPNPIRTLLEKVARSAHRVSDADVRSALDAGCGEDQVFELAVCAAVGQANRQYDAAMAALEQASKTE